MAAFDWFRWHHGTTTDPKFRVVARRSGQPLPHVLAVWAAMLECASSAAARGTLEGWDDEDVAAGLDMDPSAVSDIREAMQGKTLEGDLVSGWERRQPKRERDEDAGSSTDRVRRHREKHRNGGNADETPTKHDETPCNAEQRPRGEERRGEEKGSPNARERAKGAAPVEVGLKFLEAVGADPTPWQSGSKNFGRVSSWLAEYTADEIIAVGRRRAPDLARKRDPIAYADKLMAEEVAAIRSEESFACGASEREHDQWRQRVKGHRKTGAWVPSWGPKPSEPGCQAPADVLAEFGYGEAA